MSDKKAQMREMLQKKVYNVMAYYKTKGPAQEVARHKLFEVLTVFLQRAYKQMISLK